MALNFPFVIVTKPPELFLTVPLKVPSAIFVVVSYEVIITVKSVPAVNASAWYNVLKLAASLKVKIAPPEELL